MTKPAKVIALFAVLLVAAACGPTAQALHPTLPPRAGGTPGTPVFPAPPSAVVGPPAPATSTSPAVLPSAPSGGSASPLPPGIGQQIANFPQADAYQVSGVVPIGDGFLAVGYGPLPGHPDSDLDQALIWTSPDGMTWRVSADPALTGFTPDGVVTVGSDIYAYGDLTTCDSATDPSCPDSTTAIFKSSNGSGWEQLQQPADIQQAIFDRVVGANGLLVAWGSAADQDETTTLWTSSDGIAWTSATDLAGMDELDSATAGGPGLLAFGMRTDQQSDAEALLGATSSDGVHFTAANTPNVPDGEIDDIVQGVPGYVGVGYGDSDVNPTLALAVASADGLTWVQATTSDNSFENAYMSNVYPDSSGYVAVGSTLDENDPDYQTLRAWTSADGHSWRTVGAVGAPYTDFGASALGSHGLIAITETENDTEDGSDVVSTLDAWFVPIGQLVP